MHGEQNALEVGELPRCLDDAVPIPEKRYSVHEDSLDEIARFKWYESERAGFDVGEIAVRKWIQTHWRGYVRARWLEHLQGVRYWIELDRGDYGLLKRIFPQQRTLMNDILERLKTGLENLDVLCWAREKQQDSELVIQILGELDINSRRLRHQFEVSVGTQ